MDWAMVRAADEQRDAPDPLWWHRMGGIAAPNLLVAGGPASLVPQDEVAALAERIPDARLVTVAARRLVHESRPREFLAVAEPFLTRAVAGSAPRA